jgi:hypothetical protein
MPSLGDYVGRLLTEITEARLQADLASVRVAEMYASHPLLRHLPVPKFRLPSVTLDVPVAITNVEGSTKPGPFTGFDLPKMRDGLAARFFNYLDKSQVKLSDRGRSHLNAMLDDAIKSVSRQPDAMKTASSVADELVSDLSRAMQDEKRLETPVSKEFLTKFAEEFRGAVRGDVLGQAKPPPGVNVAVTAAELRAAGPPDLLARLRFSITEEGVEWAVTESDGTRQERLVPE